MGCLLTIFPNKYQSEQTELFKTCYHIHESLTFMRSITMTFSHPILQLPPWSEVLLGWVRFKDMSLVYNARRRAFMMKQTRIWSLSLEWVIMLAGGLSWFLSLSFWFSATQEDDEEISLGEDLGFGWRQGSRSSSSGVVAGLSHSVEAENSHAGGGGFSRIPAPGPSGGLAAAAAPWRKAWAASCSKHLVLCGRFFPIPI